MSGPLNGQQWYFFQEERPFIYSHRPNKIPTVKSWRLQAAAYLLLGLFNGKDWFIPPQVEKDHEHPCPLASPGWGSSAGMSGTTSGQKPPLFSRNPKNHRPRILLLAFRLTTFPGGNGILQAYSLSFLPLSSLTWELKHSHKISRSPQLLCSRVAVDWTGAGKRGLQCCINESSSSHNHPPAIDPKTKLPPESILSDFPTISVDSNV